MATTFKTQLALTGALALLAIGCQAAEEDDAQGVLAQDAPAEPSIDGGVVVDASVDAASEPVVDAAVQPDSGRPVRPSPDRPFFASVTANGTGCPAGSWNTAISKDGLTFTSTFSQYEVSVDEDSLVSFKDCNLTIKLHSLTGMSYALSDFYYEGYAFMEQGVTGFQTANYYFQGNPLPSVDKEKRTNLTGPVDRTYLFQDTVTSSDAVWSPCGLDRNLQIVTRLGLQKTKGSKATGYMRVDEIRAPKLMWRKC